MKNHRLLLFILVLVLAVLIACALSEFAWLRKEQTPEPLRGIIGLPSIVVGNLSPAARNPGLEMFCTGIYDQPGGYCNYYSSGVTFDDYQYIANITLSGKDK